MVGIERQLPATLAALDLATRTTTTYTLTFPTSQTWPLTCLWRPSTTGWPPRVMETIEKTDKKVYVPKKIEALATSLVEDQDLESCMTALRHTYPNLCTLIRKKQREQVCVWGWDVWSALVVYVCVGACLRLILCAVAYVSTW